MRILLLTTVLLGLYRPSYSQDLQTPRRVEIAVTRQDWHAAQTLIDQFYAVYPKNPNELQLVAKYELDKWIPLVRKNTEEEKGLYERILADRNVTSAQTYLDRYPFGKYRLPVAWVLASTKNTVTSYENFLSQYPTSEEAKIARQRIQDADKSAFERAKTAFSVPSFDSYLQQFPQGKFVAEARSLREDAREIEAFESAQVQGSIGSWQTFLNQFPSGKKQYEAAKALENAYFQTGEVAFQRKNWSDAITQFQKYITAYPTGSRVDEAKKKLNLAKLRLKSSPQNFTFLAFERDPLTQIGLVLGGLSTQGGRLYMKIKANRQYFSRGSLLYTVDEDGYLNFDGSVRYTGDVQENQWGGLLGWSFPVVHPIHLYVGLGVLNDAAFFQADRFDSSGDFKRTSWVKYTGEQQFSFLGEAGIAVNLVNFGIFRGGVNYVNGQIQTQWGLGIRVGK